MFYWRRHKSGAKLGSGATKAGSWQGWAVVLVGQQGGAACHHTCAYAAGHPDSCYNNTIVQAKPRTPGGSIDPFAIIWFCDKHDPRKIMHDYGNGMLPIVHSNKIYNANASANVTVELRGGPSWK